MESKYGKLRRHQHRIIQVADEVASSIRAAKNVVAYVTPGGGKTMMASIYAHELIARGVVRKVCIVCPRDSLRGQVQSGFTDAANGRPLRISSDGNKSLEQGSLLGDTVGYVTTYQAIAAHPKRHAKKLARDRYLLVLDEAHHLAGQDDEDERDAEAYAMWRGKIAPLVERAAAVLVMTGTLHRSDAQCIPFVRYSEDKRPIADVGYTRRDALGESAILPIEFTLWNGQSQYVYKGARHASSLSDAAAKEQGRALRTALADVEGYVRPMLERALASWSQYRHDQYKSKAIIVCHTQAAARIVARLVAEIVRGASAVLAISDEPRAARTIQRFRDGIEGDVLVTVGMAYEGLDVPDATHLICLSNCRARPWLDQAFARVTRVNRDARCHVAADRQVAHVWAPDDARMRVYADSILEEQDEAAREMDPSRTKVVAFRRGRSSFVPDSCDMTTPSYADTDGLLTPEQCERVRMIREAFPELAHVPARRLLELYAFVPPSNQGPQGEAV